VLDLARELSKLGHEVAFFSLISKRRAIAFGLPRQCHKHLPIWVYILVLFKVILGKATPGWYEKALTMAVDKAIASRVPRCDVFIGMSGICLRSALTARKKYGAQIVIERGSQHILSQQQILRDIIGHGGKVDLVPMWMIKRELESYSIADRISVPSQEALESFVKNGIGRDRLVRNPYGVNIVDFPPTPQPQNAQPRIIFVGNWSYQKGVDILVNAWMDLAEVELMHVGSIGDAPPPDRANFRSIGVVEQKDLKKYYSQADLFVIASRQEGLALVQAQALACGLPLVCTTRTGGRDLLPFVRSRDWIVEVPSDDPSALRAAIQDMTKKLANGFHGGTVLRNSGFSLTWDVYGKRYEKNLLETFK
jgi:starch synthase